MTTDISTNVLRKNQKHSGMFNKLGQFIRKENQNQNIFLILILLQKIQRAKELCKKMCDVHGTKMLP